MELANSRQFTNTEILMDTQQEIKDLIKQAMFNVVYMIQFNERVDELIEKNLKEIEDDTLREQSKEILKRYAQKEYRLMVGLLNLGMLPLVLAYTPRERVDIKETQRNLTKTLSNLGISDYNKAFTQLASSQAKTNEFGMTLYGKSEMYARHQEQVEMVDNLKKKTNLVICDTHSDCSDRCSRWQGKIYSLDGTYGTTEDGKQYIPLEVAINDTTYGEHNGLLGYNCRHKLHPYQKGMKAIKVSEKERKKQKEITRYQRLLEREIRAEKSLVQAFKDDVNGSNYAFKELSKRKLAEHKERLKEMTTQYRKFCQDNDRVEYRSRLKID